MQDMPYLGLLTQDQDVLGYPRLSELDGLAQPGYGKAAAPVFPIEPGGPYGSMTVGIGLDHRDDVPLPSGEKADGLEIVPEGIREHLHTCSRNRSRNSHIDRLPEIRDSKTVKNESQKMQRGEHKTLPPIIEQQNPP